MPLFDFVCTGCGATFERLIRTTSQNSQAVICPVCQSQETQKKLATFAVTGGSAASSVSGVNCAPGGT